MLLIRYVPHLAPSVLRVLGDAISATLRPRAALHLENLALRHQLGVQQRSGKGPRLTAADRLLWAWLSEIWADWRSAQVIVKPETVIAWHRKGFRLFWTLKIRHGQPGRPPVSKETRKLIRRMSRENRLRDALRNHGELLKLGIGIGETSVGKYMVRDRRQPSQTWRTLLQNHQKTMVSVDFFTVPTIRFQALYVFVVLAHHRRRIRHFRVTAHPRAEWTAQQLREEFRWDSAPRYGTQHGKMASSAQHSKRPSHNSDHASRKKTKGKGTTRRANKELAPQVRLRYGMKMENLGSGGLLPCVSQRV